MLHFFHTEPFKNHAKNINILKLKKFLITLSAKKSSIEYLHEFRMDLDYKGSCLYLFKSNVSAFYMLLACECWKIISCISLNIVLA